MMAINTRLMQLLYPILTTNITGITDVFPWFAPDTAKFPWITMTPVSNNTLLTFKNTDELEDAIIQFSIFDNSPNTTVIESVMDQLEKLLHRNCQGIDFAASPNEGGLHIVWIRKVPQPQIISGPPTENFYRQGILSFSFRVQKNSCFPPAHLTP